MKMYLLDVIAIAAIIKINMINLLVYWSVWDQQVNSIAICICLCVINIDEFILTAIAYTTFTSIDATTNIIENINTL